MRRTQTESQCNFEQVNIRADWDIDFAVKKVLLEGLTATEQQRYLKQLKMQGYLINKLNNLERWFRIMGKFSH